MSEVELNWLIPPIVGEISNCQAVIICEPLHKKFHLVYQMKEILSDGSINSVDQWYHEKNVEINENITGLLRIVLEFPKNGKYEIKWFSNESLIYQHNIVISNKPNKMIFVSCDFLEANVKTKNSMWTRMLNDIDPEEKTCLMHLGDQAYMDKVFKDCVKYVRENGQSDNTNKYIIQEFGKRYSNTWIPHHNVLSSVSNYNIWDDHEIKNNMMLNDANVTNDELYVRNLATDAYSLYQESQHINLNKIFTQYSWHKRMGVKNEILVLAIERTSRIITTEEIIESVNNLTDGIETRHLILCFSSAPIPRPHNFYGNLYRNMVGDKGTFETSKFWPQDQLILLYDGLFKWLDANPLCEILVVGGDLHFGTHGVVRKNQHKINVVISSPITNQPTIDRWLAAKGMKGVHYITNSDPNNNETDITYVTISSKARRCYALVDLETIPLNITMRYSNEKLPKHLTKYIKTLISFC